jgi:hypothetical protein
VATAVTAVGMTTDRPLRVDSPADGARPVAPARHPLLGAFPLAVMTLATFLVVFAILMARLQSGIDPALSAAANATSVVRGASGGAVVTRASGSAGPAVSTSGAPAEPASPVITRTSGSSGDAESGDA